MEIRNNGNNLLLGAQPMVGAMSKSRLVRCYAMGVDPTAHLDDKDGTAENWRLAAPKERVYALMTMAPEARMYLFMHALPKEAKEEYYAAVKRGIEKQSVEYADKGVEYMKVRRDGYAKHIIFMGVLAKYLDMFMRKCKKYSIEKMYPFKLKRWLNMVEKQSKVLADQCPRVECALVNSVMQYAIPHDLTFVFDSNGMVTADMQSFFMATNEDALTKAYVQCVKVGEKYNKDIKDLIACAVMVLHVSQMAEVNLITMSNDLTLIQECAGEDTKKCQKQTLLMTQYIQEVLLVLSDESRWEKDFKKVEHLLTPILSAATEGKNMAKLLDNTFSGMSYSLCDQYLAYMAYVIKRGEPMPAMTKEHIKDLAKDNHTYMRMMRDANSVARVTSALPHGKAVTEKQKYKKMMEEMMALRHAGTLKTPAVETLARMVNDRRRKDVADGKEFEASWKRIKKEYEDTAHEQMKKGKMVVRIDDCF